MRRLGHVPALDGIRGIAIAAVVLYHFFGLPGGFLGVDLFFVLSGFLITTLLLENDRLGRFYERRARRLLPALAVVLVVCIPWGWTRVLEGGFYLGNVFRAFGPDRLSDSPLGHLWSLAEEEQFYLVWPVLLLVLARHRRRLTVALAALFFLLVCYRIGLAWTGSSIRRLYFGPDTHADGLVLGSIAALVRPRISASAARLSLAVVIAFFALASWTADWLSFGLPVFEVAAVLLVLAAADGRLPELAVRPLVWLGLISYSLYLWHQPVHVVLSHAPWVGLPIALLLAWLSYRWVEQPFRKRREVGAAASASKILAGAGGKAIRTPYDASRL